MAPTMAGWRWTWTSRSVCRRTSSTRTGGTRKTWCPEARCAGMLGGWVVMSALGVASQLLLDRNLLCGYYQPRQKGRVGEDDVVAVGGGAAAKPTRGRLLANSADLEMSQVDQLHHRLTFAARASRSGRQQPTPVERTDFVETVWCPVMDDPLTGKVFMVSVL